ncbi:MAG: IS5 family transposase [Lysobacter sp.]|nr:IS5 family transposase [Lysobacter sp.]
MEARKRKGPRPKMQPPERQALRELIAEHPLSTVGELVKLLHACTGTLVSKPTLTKAIKAEGIARIKPLAGSGYAAPMQSDLPRYGYSERHRDDGDPIRYATSLTQTEWEMVADIFDDAGERGRPAVHSRRTIVDACFYVVRTGCSWRLMPKTFPPWNAVYKLFRRWSRQGRFERMHDRLRQRWRERAERNDFPSTAILDSQSTRTSPQGGEKSFDAGKRVKGRKRNLVVDTLGLVLAVVVTAASVQDRDGAYPAMAQACAKYPTIRRVFVDSAYAGTCAERLEASHEIAVHVVRHPANRNIGRWHAEQLPLFDMPTRTYATQPKRWIVERSHAWLERARRLVMHHDRLVAVSESWVWLSEARRLLRGLSKK